MIPVSRPSTAAEKGIAMGRALLEPTVRLLNHTEMVYAPAVATEGKS